MKPMILLYPPRVISDPRGKFGNPELRFGGPRSCLAAEDTGEARTVRSGTDAKIHHPYHLGLSVAVPSGSVPSLMHAYMLVKH